MNDSRYPYEELHSFEPLSQLLDRVLESGALGRRHQLAQIATLWPVVVGEKAAPHAIPRKLDNQILTVEVDSSTWHHHLAFVREKVVEELNTKIGRKLVKKINFTLQGGSKKRARK